MVTLRLSSFGRGRGLLTRSLLFLLAASIGANAQLFTPAPGSPFPAGSQPSSVAVGDFNGDGRQDLAVANFAGNSVTVLLEKNGALTPASGSPFATGPAPQFVVVGEFNGDGKPDLATANGDGTVTVLLGNGSGGFTPAAGSPFATGISYLTSMAVGDFNGDGKLDLVAVSVNNNNNVAVLLGNGSGGFAPGPAVQFAVAGPISVAVGDFNGDGKADLAITNYYSPGIFSITVLLGNGSGGFMAAPGSPFAGGLNPRSVAVGDFNGDGKPDLAVANLSNSITLLLGDGLGGFTPTLGSPFPVGNEPWYVAVRDFNADGKLDLAVASFAGNSVTVLLGDGSGGFTVASGSPFAVGSSPESIAVGDFNGDGKPDLVTANSESNNVTMLLNSSPTITVNPDSITANPASLTFHAGVGQAAPAAIPVSVSSSPGGSTYTAVSNQSWLTVKPTSSATGGLTTVALSANPAALAAGTYLGSVLFTAPGFSDASTAVTFSLASPSGTLAPDPGSPFAVEEFVSQPTLLVVGDFNGDGKADFAVAGYFGAFSYSITVMLGNGSGGFTPTPGSPFVTGTGNLISMAVGDFNGDGKLDLAVTDSAHVTVLQGDGLGGFKVSYMSPAFSVPSSIAVGDFNGDSKLDLAVTVEDSNNVVVLLGDGSGGFTLDLEGPFASGGSYPVSIAVGDFNGDGRLDLAVVNTVVLLGSSEPGNVAVLLGDGSGGFTPARGNPSAVGSQPNSVVVADFNGDGKLDLAVANSNSGGVTVLLGDGSGGFTPAVGSPFTLGSNSESVAVGDFNGDGNVDLAVAYLVLAGGGPCGTGCATVLLGNGSGGFTASPVNPFATAEGPNAVAAADFNGDGKVDLAIAITGSNIVTVLLGALATTSSFLSTTSASTITLGTPVPLTFTVSQPLGGFSTPAGTETFLDGTSILGTATQTGNPYTFTASSLGLGSHTLSATYSGDLRNNASSSNSITIQVKAFTATVTLGNLAANYDGTPKPATATTNPPGLAVNFTYNGSPTAPMDPGAYTVAATVNDPTYAGSATGTLIISGITLLTSPAGLQVSVDGGTPQVAPFILSLPDGPHTITAVQPQLFGSGQSALFSSWSDSGAATHTITVTRTPVTYTATFILENQLTTASSPPNGGTVSPAGAFYLPGSVVAVQATANPGYRFVSFSGSLTGSANPQNVTMNAPANVVGNFMAIAPAALAASVGARTDVVAGITRQVTITLTNTGAGAAMNATITSITGISVVAGSGSVSVASGVPVDIGTIGTAAAANAAAIFIWPTTATKVRFTANFTADGGYSGSTTITTLR